jgi:hypothetical protein
LWHLGLIPTTCGGPLCRCMGPTCKVRQACRPAGLPVSTEHSELLHAAGCLPTHQTADACCIALSPSPAPPLAQGVALDDLVYIMTKLSRQMEEEGIDKIFAAAEAATAAIKESQPLLQQATSLVEEVTPLLQVGGAVVVCSIWW